MEKAGEGLTDHWEKLPLTLQEIGNTLLGSNPLWPLPNLLPGSLPSWVPALTAFDEEVLHGILSEIKTFALHVSFVMVIHKSSRNASLDRSLRKYTVCYWTTNWCGLPWESLTLMFPAFPAVYFFVYSWGLLWFGPSSVINSFKSYLFRSALSNHFGENLWMWLLLRHSLTANFLILRLFQSL